MTEEVEAAAIASSAACRLELATVVLSPSILTRREQSISRGLSAERWTTWQ